MKFSEYEKNQLKAFFQEVYGRVWEAFQKHYPEAYIEVRALPPDKKDPPTREFFPIHSLGFEKAVEEAIAYAEKLNSEEKKYNVFWGIALRKERKGSKEATIPYIAFVPFDLDILKDHLHLTEELPNMEPEEAREKVLNYYYQTIRPRFEKFGLIPTWTYYSGHGVQGIWVLKDFITEAELLELKPYLVEGMGSDSKIYEFARILRIPFSTNWKIPEHPKKGDLIEYNPEAVYSFKELRERIREYYKEFAPKKPPATTPSVDLSELRKRYSQTKRPPCVEKALNGVSEGSRNQTAYFLASYFAQIGWKLQEIEDFLINEWDPRNKPPIAENDGVNSLKATIRSAYESVTGKSITGGPKAQKLSGCSWARSLGLCPFKSLIECPIGRRAIANKLRAVVKEIDNTPRTLEELRSYIIENFPGSAKWVNELIAYLEAKGLKEITKLDLIHVLRELNPSRKRLEKSPREEAKKEKAKGEERPVKSLEDFDEEELKDIARYYIMRGIELDEGKLPFIKIDPPTKFFTLAKKGRKVVLEPNYELISKFAMKLGVKPEDLISGWELVEKVKEAFNIPDEEVRAIIVEAIKDMATTPHARLPPCIEGIIDKVADGEAPTDKELSYLASWIKYRSQGRIYARLKRGKDKARRIELFKFMVEMLPGFEGDLGTWLTKFLKLYEDAEPFKCPAKDPDIRPLCNPDKCPLMNPLSNVEAILSEIEAVYIYGKDKMGIVIDGKEESLDYVPPLETRSTNNMLRKFLAELEDAYGTSLFLDPEELLEVFQDLRRRAIRKPPLLSEEDVIEEALIKFFLDQLETGVVDFKKIGLVEDYISYDPGTGIIYIGNKNKIIQVINTAMEKNGFRKFGEPEGLTPVLKKLKGFYLGPTKHRYEIYNSEGLAVSKTTLWRFNVGYLEKAIGRKITPRFLDRSEIFYAEPEPTEKPREVTEKLELTVAGAIREIKALLKEKPRKYEELYQELEKRGYPQKIVTEALEELMSELKYNPKTDEYSLRTEGVGV